MTCIDSMLETFTVYPNIFHNPPDLFKAGLEFMTVRTPHDFYPPLVSAAGCLVARRSSPR